jgi:hypothetical protein
MHGDRPPAMGLGEKGPEVAGFATIALTVHQIGISGSCLSFEFWSS